MDLMIEILKYASVIVGAIAPIFKIFFLGNTTNRQSKLEEQNRLLALFYAEGDVKLPPIRREAALGAALGHNKLTAQEIPLVLRQQNPSSFISEYLRVRSYLAPNKLATEFELRAAAAKPWLSKLLQLFGLLIYLVFSLGAFWMLLYVMPQAASNGNWGGVASSVVLALGFGVSGIFVLVEVSKLNWAKKLHVGQLKSGAHLNDA